MTWARKRQLTYLSIVILILSGVAFWFARPYFTVPPNCFDGKQNGEEAGVDCGGSCALQCAFQVDHVAVLWTRTFEVVPSRYNAVAYLENNNINTAVYKIKYRFRFSDKNNLYIGKREGETVIPPSGKFAIFEPAIDLGNSVPVYTTFEFAEPPVWVKVPKDRIEQIKLYISDINLQNEDTTPRLSAVIENKSFFTIPDVHVVAILYDELGNAVSASKTYIDPLKREESRDLTFTWPKPFNRLVTTTELIPIFNIFNVRLE